MAETKLTTNNVLLLAKQEHKGNINNVIARGYSIFKSSVLYKVLLALKTASIFVLVAESTYNLCLKDLSKAMIEEMAFKLESDPVAMKRFCQSFGLDPQKTFYGVLKNIRELFPDTPVRLLKDVFVAIKLYDLVELLEKAKPRTLRPAHPMKEIEKLANAGNFPSTFYIKPAVLIIDNTTTLGDDTAKRIESFFKSVNSQSKVTAITAKPLIEIRHVLEELEKTRRQWNLEPGAAERTQKTWETRLAEVQRYMKDCGDRLNLKVKKTESSLKMQLEKLKEKEKWNEEEKPKIDKEIKQKKEERIGEIEKLQMNILSVLDEWTGSEGWLKLRTMLIFGEKRSYKTITIIFIICLLILINYTGTQAPREQQGLKSTYQQQPKRASKRTNHFI